MPRRGSIAKRDVLADPLYNSKLVTRLINNIMVDGKRGVAQKIVYGAFDIIREKTDKDPLEVFEQSMENILNKQLDYMAGEAEQYPAGFSAFLMALSDFLEPPVLITVVPNGEDLSDLPFLLPSDAIVKVLERPSEGYKLLNEETTFYVCRNHSCLPPMNKRQLMTEIQKQYQT